jgi:hypothetical protein
MAKKLFKDDIETPPTCNHCGYLINGQKSGYSCKFYHIYLGPPGKIPAKYPKCGIIIQQK